MERKIHWALGAFLGMAILFSGAVSPAADMVKIGASYPTSGGVAEAASWVIDGLKMAVEDINAKGGIPIEGKQLKVEMVLYDSKCDPTTGVGAVEKLISRDRVVAITGDYCSSVTLAEKEVSGRNKIVQVTPIAIHPKITEPGYPYMFRICNTIDMYVAPMVDFVATRLKIKNISLLAVTDDYGRGEVTSYSEQYAKKGVKVTGVEYFKHGDTDFYTQITKLLATKPEAMYVVTNEDSQNIGALKQIRELGFKGQLIGCSTYNTDNMVKLGGEQLLEGLYLESPPFELIKDQSRVKEWLQKYKSKFGREGNGFSLGGYQSVQLLCDAIRRANSLTDKEKIREALAKTNLREVCLGFHGDPNFDANGQAIVYVGVVQCQKGKRVPVYGQDKK